MAAQKGFTLIELLVVLVIIGIVAAFTLPNLIASSEQTKAQEAQNNLLALAAAEQKYLEDYSVYCTSTTPVGMNPPCGDDNADLATNLHSSISDSFTYNCIALATSLPAPIQYQCTAGDNTDTLTLSENLNAQGTAVVGVSVSCAGLSGHCPANGST